MADREKVINAIECCIDGCLCAECDYEGTEGCWNKVLLTDALALLKEQEHKDKMFHALEDDWKRLKELLKEQEAVKPRVSTVEQRCGNCNKVIEMDGWITCPWCGKMIDWERWWNENGTHDNS